MGTRALTRVCTDSGKQIINLYRQHDGYPDGHGKELFEFLQGFQIVNGISGDEGPKAANGARCLAAQMVAHFKRDIGSFYLYPTDTKDCGQDYEYIVTVKEVEWNAKHHFGSVMIEVIGYKGREFSGSVDEFGAFCAAEPADEE